MDLREKLSALPGNPQKVLKIVIGLAFVLLLMWVLTLSHIDSGSDPSASETIATQQVSDSLQTTDSSQKSLIPGKSSDETSGMLSSGLVTFFVLVIVLGGIWFWVDKKGGGHGTAEQREIDSEMLAQGATMKILKVNNEVWVLGVTSQSVDLLHRYPQEEWTESMPDPEAGSDHFAKLFKSKL